MEDSVVLVDEFDNPIGTMPKMEAHRSGLLHRAFSVFVFNTDGQLLLQQRAFNKYHSGGKWTNTCCSHPYPHEEIAHAANRRLKQEMGMQCQLYYAFNFVYKAIVDSITEHEYDHVFIGISNTLPHINTAEAAAYKYMHMDTLAADLQQNPQQYSEWLKICFERVMEQYNRL